MIFTSGSLKSRKQYPLGSPLLGPDVFHKKSIFTISPNFENNLMTAYSVTVELRFPINIRDSVIDF